ncbi:MAG: hybrid sensor histidine kinase/response regulator [Pseudomonadota bacterium]
MNGIDNSLGPVVLYVDDEKLMRSAFRRTVRREAYEVLLAESGAEGLELLATREIAVVVSDARMPQMDGVEFLQAVSERSPDSVRILLTGYTDHEMTVNAINEAGVFRYLSKPWNKTELLDTITTAIEQRDLRLQTRRALALAQAANQAKSEFLANISHELRTPLHAVLSFSRLAKKRLSGGDINKQLHYLEKIGQNGELLLELVNGLLDLSKLDAGAVHFKPTATDLAVLVREEVSALESLFEEKSLRVNRDLVEPSMCRVDPEHFPKVIRNLLGNAAKFAPNGTAIDVCLRATGDVLEVSIGDHGQGVDEDELRSIFDKFVQAKKTKTGAGGTGLGLAITKEIVEAHGGTIAAEATPGGGLTVRFSVPSLSAAEATIHRPPRPETPALEAAR